jgi:DeoR family transcriptional regulator, aga operon transcriptional repressor
VVCYIFTQRMRKKHKQLTPRPSEERKGEMLLFIKEKGSASIGELADHFSVSGMTVRRVLYKLADGGLVIRTPGGAMVAPSGSMEKTFLQRSERMAEAKDALGRAAAALVGEGETVVLDSGTTTWYLARHLAAKRNLVVVTPSLAVLEALAGSTGIQTRLTGGVYRRTSHDLFGSAVDDALGNIFADWVFFGAGALSFQKGAMNYDAEMSKSFLKAGKQKVLVIDSGKVGTEAVYRLCPIEHCDLVITDKGVNGADLKRLRKLTKVIIAE